MRIKTSILFLFIIFSAVSHLFSQGTGSLSGTVVDSKTGESLFGANIMVQNTQRGTAAGPGGHFKIEYLTPGVYALTISMMGYEDARKDNLQVYPDQETYIKIELKPTVIEQPAIIVTASKRKQRIEDAQTSVDVIGIRDIQSKSVVNLDQVIQYVPGVSIIDGQVDIRGSTGFNWAAGSRVLVLVDGHPLINGDTGGISWDVIPPDEVERVEIVKGAGSALYGSNAMAGMINIITKDPLPDPQTRIKLSWGFYDEPAYPEWRWSDRFYTYKISNLNEYSPLNTLSFESVDFTHSRRIGKVGLHLALGRRTSRGYHQNGDYNRWNVLLKTKIRFSPEKTLAIAGHWALDDHGDVLQWESIENPLKVPDTELGNRVRNEKANLHATFKNSLSPVWYYTVKANIFRVDWKNEFQDNQDYAVTDRYGSELQFDHFRGQHAFTFGLETIFQHTNSIFYGDHDTRSFAIYGEDEVKFSKLWTFTLGTRYDYHQVLNISTGQQLSPRLGIVYKPSKKTSIRGSAGYGFRAPSIAEIFADITVSGIRVIPNFDLTEERAWNFELGIRQQLVNTKPKKNSEEDLLKSWLTRNLNPQIMVDLSVFASRYKNMIDVDINPEISVSEVQFQNLGRAKNQGVECRIQGIFFNGGFSTQVGYTVIDPINLDTGKMLNYRSRHRLTAGFELRWRNLTLGYNYRYASRAEEIVNLLGSAFDERVPMHVSDCRLLYQWKNYQIGVEGKNIRNYNYTLRQKFLEPIRHFVFTFRAKFD